MSQPAHSAASPQLHTVTDDASANATMGNDALQASSTARAAVGQAADSPPSPPRAVNFATEWLDELGCICPKAVDYASQCPKGHALVPVTGGGSGDAALPLMCRVCHTLSARDDASLWLQCTAAGCCAGYAVCASCLRALQHTPAAAAGGDDFPSQVRSVNRLFRCTPGFAHAAAGRCRVSPAVDEDVAWRMHRAADCRAGVPDDREASNSAQPQQRCQRAHAAARHSTLGG